MTDENMVNEVKSPETMETQTEKSAKTYRRTTLLKRLLTGNLPGFVAVVLLVTLLITTDMSMFSYVKTYLDMESAAESASLMEAETYEMGKWEYAYADSFFNGNEPQQYLDKVEGSYSELVRHLNEIKGYTDDEEITSRVDGLLQQADQLKLDSAAASKELQDSKGTNSSTLNTVLTGEVQDTVAAVEEMKPLVIAQRDEARSQLNAAVTRNLIVQFVVLVISVGVTVWFMRRIRHNIVGSVSSVEEALRAMSVGDLTRSAAVLSNDEISDMSHMINQSGKLCAEPSALPQRLPVPCSNRCKPWRSYPPRPQNWPRKLQPRLKLSPARLTRFPKMFRRLLPGRKKWAHLFVKFPPMPTMLPG